jgi:hypothetical protein
MAIRSIKGSQMMPSHNLPKLPQQLPVSSLESNKFSQRGMEHSQQKISLLQE